MQLASWLDVYKSVSDHPYACLLNIVSAITYNNMKLFSGSFSIILNIQASNENKVMLKKLKSYQSNDLTKLRTYINGKIQDKKCQTQEGMHLKAS